MEDEKGGGSNPSRVSSSFAPAATGSDSSPCTSNERQRFTVELRPGETTIVSWKKLIKEANKANRPHPVVEPPTGAHPALESRIAPVQPDESELKDAPPSHRFSAVIEKIERLYMGKHSSDEEELDDVPDEDQYDTEDSFIDDAELNEYFEVDKSATKHNGFFVNRGKLERINEPVMSPNHQPRKRRRKDITKARGEKVDDHMPDKNAKMGNVRMKAAARTAPLVENKTLNASQSTVAMSEYHQDVKPQNYLSSSIGTSKKKYSELEHSSSLKISSRDASIFPTEAKDGEKQKIGVGQCRDPGNKSKVTIDSADVTHVKYQDKSNTLEPQSRRIPNDTNELEVSSKVRQRDKNITNELPDLNYPGSKIGMQTVKSPMHRKEGSSVRPKGKMLERAIRELENMVAESRPQTIEIQDADTSSQAVKRRLPREVKQKLAKVARLASSQGKISVELINRLMSILGHLVQLRTLKRNLKEMVELGLSAKQEKDDRFQQIKKEIVEMIKTRGPSLKLKASEQRDGASDDFQDLFGSDEKALHKGKYCLDNTIEDKICDLYDLYVEGMDEDKGPRIRKLYVELAELWPEGFMDNHGIKSAICRAKERKRALYSRHKDQGKMKRKKLSTPKTEVVHNEAGSIAQPRSVQERPASDPGTHIITSPNRMASNTTVNQQLSTSMRTSIPSINGASIDRDRPKQDKVRGSSTYQDEVRRSVDGTLMKKLKKKPESDMVEAHFRSDKLSLQQGKERHKSQKQVATHTHKSSLPPPAPSSEQPS